LAEPVAVDRAVADVLSVHIGNTWALSPQAGSGFCRTWRAQPAGRSVSAEPLFVKSAPTTQGPMLQAEADGLAALAAAACIKSPAVVGCWIDTSRDLAVLAMEWLDLAPHSRAAFGKKFGRQLATLHTMSQECNGHFGWRCDNWIGGTPQRNRSSDRGGLQGWLDFFAQERLGAMAEKLSVAGSAPALLDGIQRVIDALPQFFADGHMPRPSLIHGDLWSGNWGSLQDGSPVIFDPAVSISDAEAELAMMELFGAPPAGFWPAYRRVAKLSDGYAERRKLYQLYHVLNHALLFGPGYARQARSLIDSLMARR
jgi:fructosamine-3-kinase